MSSAPVVPFDALLVVSFGGPERAEDVLPFLENVTRGRAVPRERLVEVALHYEARGGKSPINDQCRALVAAVEADLAAAGLQLPVYWGNRNWDPYLTDTVAKMAAGGVRRAAAFVTSAYASYSGCRQYRENLYDAVATLEPGSGPRIDKLRHYFNHPGFVTAMVETTRAALDSLPADDRDAARLVFVTHSVPTAMATTSGPHGDAYVSQHRSVARLVADVVAPNASWDLVYCSRSGAPQLPWLEPDISDHLVRLAALGVGAVVVVPIGFVSDHMEVVHDLDTEAATTARELGLGFARAATAGTHPAFVAAVRELILERAAVERGEDVVRPSLGDLGPTWDACVGQCCPNPDGERPALCEVAGR